MMNMLEWRDIVEISFFVLVFYRIMLWLNRDTKKNLVGYFLSYCAIFFIAYMLNLPTICSCMMLYTPIIIIFFILIHEQTLQRNFITPVNDIVVNTQNEWIDTVISNCLYVTNEQKSITYLIEHKDNLSHTVTSPCLINAPICSFLLRVLTTNSLYKQDTMIWITSKGIVRGINATWQNDNSSTHYAIQLTAHTDSIIVAAHPTNRTFSIIARGNQFEQVSAEHAILLIKQCIHSVSLQPSKGAVHEKRNKRTISSEKSTP